MAYKHMKTYLISLVIMVMLIKTTVRFYFTLTRIAVTKKMDNTKYWQGYGEIGTLMHSWWDCKVSQLLEKSVRLHIGLPYDSTIPPLGIYPKEIQTCPHDNLYTDVHSSIFHNCQKAETTQNSGTVSGRSNACLSVIGRVIIWVLQFIVLI